MSSFQIQADILDTLEHINHTKHLHFGIQIPPVMTAQTKHTKIKKTFKSFKHIKYFYLTKRSIELHDVYIFILRSCF